MAHMGVVRAMRRILRSSAVLSMMRQRNSIDHSSEFRGEVQGNVHRLTVCTLQAWTV